MTRLEFKRWFAVAAVFGLIAPSSSLAAQNGSPGGGSAADGDFSGRLPGSSSRPPLRLHPRRKLSTPGSDVTSNCGGELKACLACDAIAARSVMARESRSLQDILTHMVEDLQVLNAQTEALLRMGGAAAARSSLSICDDGPGTMRPPDYCGENSSEVCPGTWTGDLPTCAQECAERDWGSVSRNWAPGTYLGHSDCDLERVAELWAANTFYKDYRKRFVADGNDLDDTGHSGSWIGLRTRESDLAVADNLRLLVPSVVSRNTMASAFWAGTSSDVWVYWPPLPSSGVGNWNMGDIMGEASVDLISSSTPENDWVASAGEYVTVATPHFNPERETVWTTPYQDPMGAGMMITVSQPWYFTGSFMGVEYYDTWMGAFGMDIVLQDHVDLLTNLKLSANTQCLIVNDNLHVIFSSDAAVQLLFNSSNMTVTDTVRSAPTEASENCKVCCSRASADCVMSLTEANGTDWVSIQEALLATSPGTTQGKTQKLYWPSFATSEESFQGRYIETLFLIDRWTVDSKGGEYSMLCVLPVVELDQSTMVSFQMHDGQSSIRYRIENSLDDDENVLDLRADPNGTSEAGSFSVTNDGTLDLSITDIEVPEGLLVDLGSLPLSLAVGATMTIPVRGSANTSHVDAGDNTFRIILTFEDDGYQDCSFKAEETVYVDLFIIASTCPQGFYLDSSAGVCQACSPGWYKSDEGPETCSRCPAGYSTNELSGAVNCTACEAGYHTENSNGATSCTACSAGTYSATEASLVCTKCPIGRYQNETRSTACHLCPTTTTTLESGSSIEERCVCDVGQYWSNATSSCETCLEGLNCDWESSDDLEVAVQSAPPLLAGYFALEEDLVTPWSCFSNELRCPGGPAGTCGDGRIQNSFLCAECRSGSTSRSDGSCKECGIEDASVLLLTGIVVVTCLCGLYFAAGSEDRAKQSKSTLMVVLVSGLVLNVFQQFSVLALIQISWPEPFGGFLKAMSFFNLVALVFNLFSVGCYADISAFVVYASGLLLVLALFAILFVVHCIFSLWYHRGEIWPRIGLYFASAGSVAMMLMVAIVSGILGPLQCQLQPNGHSTMLSNDSVVCWTSYPFAGSDHSNMVYLSIGACSLPVGFLSLSLWAVSQLPSRLQRGDAQFVRNFFFLFSRFRVECYWYGIVVTVRSCLVAMVPAITDTSIQWCALSSVFLASMVSKTMLWPWRFSEANRLDIFFSICLLLEMGAVALLIEEPDKRRIGWFAMGVVFAIFCGLLACGIQILSDRCRRGKVFQFFLCHHKSGAGNLARLIKLHLVAHSSVQRKVFVDSDDLQDLSTLFVLIQNDTERLVLLCSRDVLRRDWCLGEVTIACTNGLPITLVTLSDFTFFDEQAIEEVAMAAATRVLASHGIDSQKIRSVLVGLPQHPRIAVSETISNPGIARLVERLVSKPVSTSPESGLQQSVASDLNLRSLATTFQQQNTPEGTSLEGSTRNSLSSFATELQATRILLCNRTSTEAICTACIVQRLLAPLITEVVHILDLEELPPLRRVSQVIILCSNGLFEQPHTLRALWRASEVEADFLVCTCEPTFRFPNEYFYQSLRRTAGLLWPKDLENVTPLSSGSQYQLAPSLSSSRNGYRAEMMVRIVSAIFHEIAVEINPQDHEDVLALRISSLAARILDNGRSKRGTEQRQLVLTTEAYGGGDLTSVAAADGAGQATEDLAVDEDGLVDEGPWSHPEHRPSTVVASLAYDLLGGEEVDEAAGARQSSAQSKTSGEDDNNSWIPVNDIDDARAIVEASLHPGVNCGTPLVRL